MASSILLLPVSHSLVSSPKPLSTYHHQLRISGGGCHLLLFRDRSAARRLPTLAVGASNNDGGESADPPDRLLAAACYFYPFLDGVHYGRFILSQFPAFGLLLQPLVPAIRLFRSSPFTPALLFLTLYFAVVRNPSRFGRFVRFNTMQAIVLDVLLIFPELLERSVPPGTDGIAVELFQSFDSTVFLFLLVSLVYGSTSCLLGQVPRLPLVAEAAERQVM